MVRHWRQIGWIAAVVAMALLVAACGREEAGAGGGGGGGGGGSWAVPTANRPFIVVECGSHWKL